MNILKSMTNIFYLFNTVVLIIGLLYGPFITAEEDVNPTDVSSMDDMSNSDEMPDEDSVPHSDDTPTTDDSSDVEDVSSTDDLSNSQVPTLSKVDDLSDEEKHNFLFLNLTTIHSFITGMGYGGDFGYGRNLVSKRHYFGFVEVGLGLIGLLSPGLVFKYGYVLLRKNAFSIGLNGIISPVLWTNNLPFIYLNDDFHLIYGAKLFAKIKLSKTSALLIRLGIMYVTWPLSNQINQQWNNQMQWAQWNQQWANQQFWLGNQIWINRQTWTRNFNVGVGIRTYF